MTVKTTLDGPRPQELEGRQQLNLLRTAVTEPAPRVRVVHVTGEIDMETAPRLRSVLERQLALFPQAMLLDFTGVSFLSATGLAVIDEAVQASSRLGTGIALIATHRAVRRPVQITLLDRTLPVADSLDDALHRHVMRLAPS